MNMAENIGGLTTVNGGTIIPFEDSAVEVLGPGYSSHPNNIVVGYSSEGNVKVSVVLCGKRCWIYRFRSYDSLQHYWSREYPLIKMIESNKYGVMTEFLMRAQRAMFGA